MAQMPPSFRVPKSPRHFAREYVEQQQVTTYLVVHAALTCVSYHTLPVVKDLRRVILRMLEIRVIFSDVNWRGHFDGGGVSVKSIFPLFSRFRLQQPSTPPCPLLMIKHFLTLPPPPRARLTLGARATGASVFGLSTSVSFCPAGIHSAVWTTKGPASQTIPVCRLLEMCFCSTCSDSRQRAPYLVSRTALFS